MMDYTTTAEESCSLLSFRIRCPRSRKRAVREDREKRWIRLSREEDQLGKRNSWKNAEYVPLDPPVQRGFKRIFVLRDDVAALPTASFYQGILDKINTELVHPERHFLKKVRKRGKKKKPIPQFLQEPGDADFRKLNFSEKEAKLFYLGPPSRHELNDGRLVWKFSQQWRFRLKIRPNIIAWQKVEYIEVEKRLKEIDNYMAARHLRCKMQRMWGCRVSRCRGKETGKFPRKRHHLHYWLQAAEEGL